MSEHSYVVFSNNLRYWLEENHKNQMDLVNDLGFKQSTVSDWINGKKYPRIDSMQKLADYFGILKSDLTEEKHTNFFSPRTLSHAKQYEQLDEEGKEAVDFATDREARRLDVQMVHFAARDGQKDIALTKEQRQILIQMAEEATKNKNKDPNF